MNRNVFAGRIHALATPCTPNHTPDFGAPFFYSGARGRGSVSARSETDALSPSLAKVREARFPRFNAGFANRSKQGRVIAECM